VRESTDALIAGGGEDAFVMFSRNRRRPELSLVMGYLRELRQQARVATGAGVAPVTRREATTRPAALGARTEAGVKRRQ
jgi:hypothetical protein